MLHILLGEILFSSEMRKNFLKYDSMESGVALSLSSQTPTWAKSLKLIPPPTSPMLDSKCRLNLNSVDFPRGIISFVHDQSWIYWNNIVVQKFIIMAMTYLIYTGTYSKPSFLQKWWQGHSRLLCNCHMRTQK